MRLRQVALVAADLADAERQLTGTLGVERCFRDPGVAVFGLENALFPVGTGFLEVVSPTTGGTTAGRFLERRGGDGGYMVILQTEEDLDAVRARLAGLDIRIVFEAPAPGITGLHLHPRDVGGAILSIDRTDDWDAWPWAGPVWRDHVVTDTVTAMAAVEIAAGDPTAMCARWAAALGRVPEEPTTIRLDEGVLRFVPADADRGEGVDALDLVGAAGQPARTEVVVGCTVRILPGDPAEASRPS
jgi:hypothetical protein